VKVIGRREQCLTYFPAVFGDEVAGERREDERAYTGAANGDAVGQCAPLVEVEADRYDRRQIEQTDADTCQSIIHTELSAARSLAALQTSHAGWMHCIEANARVHASIEFRFSPIVHLERRG